MYQINQDKDTLYYTVTCTIGNHAVKLYQVKESSLIGVMHTWLVIRLQYTLSMNSIHCANMFVAGCRDVQNAISYEITKTDESDTKA